MNVNCNLCNSRNYKRDYLVSGNLRYAKCNNCGLIFQYPMMNQEELERIYDSYFSFRGQLCCKEYGYQNYETERSINCFRKKYYLDWLNKHIADKGAFLDFGCGTGNLVKLVMDEGHIAEGCEFSSEAISILSEKGIPFYRYEDINKTDKKYKYISMIDVIEHLRDPSGILKTINLLLEDNGLLFIETVNSDDFFAKYIYKNNWQGISPVHLYLFGENTLIKLLEKSCFKVMSMKRYKMSGSWTIQSLKHVTKRLILLFCKKDKFMNHNLNQWRKDIKRGNSFQFSFGDGIRIVAKKNIKGKYV